MVANVVVVGAGYAGVMAANRLVGRGDGRVRVTVVNPRAEFVERIRLHQLVAGSGAATVRLGEVLDPIVQLRVSSVIEIRANSVALSDGGELDFDQLVYAVGSGASAPAHTHSVGTLDDARDLGVRLAELRDGETVTVVGAGLTGIETAAEIAQARPTLTVRLLSDGPIGHGLPDGGRRRIETQLRRGGVEVCTGVRVRRALPDAIELDDGRLLPSACTVWAVGFTVPELARTSGLPVDRLGRLRTDDRLVWGGRMSSGSATRSRRRNRWPRTCG